MQVDGATVVIHNCAGGGEAWEGSGGWRRWRLLYTSARGVSGGSSSGVFALGSSASASWVGTSPIGVDSAFVFEGLACGIREACGLFFLRWACHFGTSCFYRCGSTAVSYGGGVGISCFYRIGSTADSFEVWNQLLLPKWEHSRFFSRWESVASTKMGAQQIQGGIRMRAFVLKLLFCIRM